MLTCYSTDVASNGKRAAFDITFDGISQPYSSAERTTILNKHRQFRGEVSPGAANMEYMVKFLFFTFTRANLALFAGAWCVKGT